MKYEKAAEIEKILGLDRSLVGISFLKEEKYNFTQKSMRYCEALVRASVGNPIVFKANNSLCPSSDVALGITESKYANILPRIRQKTGQILIAPLNNWKFKENPDIVIAICDPYQAMQISIALGSSIENVDGSIAVCGLTAFTISEDKPSLSLLCNSCRLYAGVKNNELGISFPFNQFIKLEENIKKIGSVSPKISISKYGLMPSSRLILSVLNIHGKSTQKELRRISGLSERSVRNAIKQLIDYKIMKEKSYLGDMRKKSYEVA